MDDCEVLPLSTDTLERLAIANTGSIGLPYDGDKRASYAVVEDATVIIRRVEYDFEREARELLTNHYPHAEWLSSIPRTAPVPFAFLGGISLLSCFSY
jgi:hypothetical protein